MNKIVKLAAVASIVVASSSASAFWGNGSNMGDMVNDFFGDACLPLLSDFMTRIDTDVIGRGLEMTDSGVDNKQLIEVNSQVRSHPVEAIGQTLRGYMSAMKRIS